MTALYSNTTGSGNIAIGVQTLYHNTTGGSNLAMGYNAMINNTIGFNNVALGFGALPANTTGAYNTAVGVDLMTANTTGSANTALGYQALNANTTGTNNVAIGYNVGSVTLATGSNNILIGTSSAVDTPAAGTNNFLNIGNTIFATSTNTGTVSAPAGFVGIGTASPAVPLHVLSTTQNKNSGTSILRVESTASTNPSATFELRTSSSQWDFWNNGTSLVIGNGDNTGNGAVLQMFYGASYTNQVGVNTTNAQISTFAVNGSVAIGDSSYWNGGSAPTNGLIVKGNVGIGSTTPNSALDISQKNDAVSLPSGTSAQRPSGVNGMIRYSQTNSALEAYYGGAWNTLTASGGGSSVNLGAAASTTNPQRSGQADTGIFSATSATVSVAVDVSGTGTDEADFSSAGLNLPQAAESYKIAGNNAFWQDIGNSNLAVGQTAFPTTVSQSGGGWNGTNNTTIGVGALNANTTGYWNVAIGPGTLALNTTGAQNTGIGFRSLDNNTTGAGNTAIGPNTLHGNTTGTNNTAVGAGALYSNTFGASNTATGLIALTSNSSGSQNTAIGYATMSNNTTGGSNVALGWEALSGNTTGGSNTAVGASAGGNITTGSNNTAVGEEANGGTTASDNTAVGHYALRNTTTGAQNVMMGSLTGWRTTTGANNTALGMSALGTNTTGSNNTILGYSVGGTTLNGGSSNILIGTSSAVDTPGAGSNYYLNIGGTITGTMTLGTGGTALVIGTSTDDGAIMTFAGEGAITLPSGTIGQRPSSPANGMLRYSQTTPGLEAYYGGAWNTLTASGGGSSVNLGTAASTTNPQRSGQADTGMFSATSATVSVAVDVSGTGTDEADFSASGLNLPVATETLKIGSNNAHWQDNTNVNMAIGATAFPTTVSQTGGGTNGQGDLAVGYHALNANTTGAYNTAVGQLALQVVTTGAYNTAIGTVAMLATTTGSGNTAVGAFALDSNTTGSSNTALGNTALAGNTTGQNNTVVGYTALWHNTTGIDNTGVGANVLAANTTGTNNTAVGYNVASTTLATGQNNILIGVDSTTDTYAAATSTAIGIGQGVKPGTNDIAIGYLALANNGGNSQNNTAIGYQALHVDSTGGNNVAVGFDALDDNTTGYGNTALGTTTLVLNGTGIYNTAVGNNALYNNTANYNTGLGYATLFTNTTGVNNTAVGYQAGLDITTGSHNIMLGDYATTGVGITTGSNNIMIGQDVRPVSRTASNQLNIGNLIYATGLASGTTASTGSVGIGTTSPAYTLDVNGQTHNKGEFIDSSYPSTSTMLQINRVPTGGDGQYPLVVLGPTTPLAGTSGTDWNTSGTWIGANPSSYGGDYLDFQLNNAYKFRVNSSGAYIAGSVGIGTTSPGGALDVRGNFTGGGANTFGSYDTLNHIWGTSNTISTTNNGLGNSSNNVVFGTSNNLTPYQAMGSSFIAGASNTMEDNYGTQCCGGAAIAIGWSNTVRFGVTLGYSNTNAGGGWILGYNNDIGTGANQWSAAGGATAIGALVGSNASNAIAIGLGQGIGGSYSKSYNSTANSLMIFDGSSVPAITTLVGNYSTTPGNVGIGTASPAQALEVNGKIQVDTLASASATTLCINSSVISSCSSSIRYKENVKDLDMGMDELMKMRPVAFKWKGRDENDFGFIAEEMHKINPLFNTYNKDNQIEGVKYTQLTAVIVKAIQKQQHQIEDDHKLLIDVKATTDKNKTDIADLKKQVTLLSGKHKGSAIASPAVAEESMVQSINNEDHLLLFITSGIAILAFAGMGGMGIMMIRMRKEIRRLARAR